MKKLTWLILLLITIQLQAQESGQKKVPLMLSVFNNGTTLPGGGIAGVFTVPVHPGFTAGTFLKYRNTEKSEIFETFRLGCYYHHLSMTGIQLYTDFGYRYKFNKSFAFDVALMAGYLHSIPGIQVFVLNDLGVYEPKTMKVRAQFISGLDAGFSYRLNRDDEHSPFIFINYQFYLEMPFVSGYVPMLPNTALHLGYVFYFNR